MDLRWLDDFLTVFDCGSFTQAAQRRGVSQSGLSRRIQALEQWVGAPLFDRLAQPLLPTAAGRRFAPLAIGLRSMFDGARRSDLHVSITHTRHCAVAAVSLAPVGVDACDDDDGPRLPRMAKRVFDDGEAEACDAHASAETQAAVWALKEAGLKLHGGGIFMPGLRSVRVESLEPARVADPSMRVALYRLPHAAVAVASMHAGRASADDSRTDPAGSGRVTRRRPGMGSVGFGWTLLSTRIVRERPG